jgi:hypothetical protein
LFGAALVAAMEIARLPAALHKKLLDLVLPR